MAEDTLVADIKKAGGTRSTRMRIHTWIMLAMVLVAAAAGVVGVGAVLAAGLPDWYMHLGMWVVLAAWVMVYLNSFYARRVIRQFITLVLFFGISFFWLNVLLALIPAQPMVIRGDLVQRDSLDLLYLPLGLLGLEGLLMLGHALVVGRWRWQDK